MPRASSVAEVVGAIAATAIPFGTSRRAAVARLPDAQRLALTLHYFEDQRYEDVADFVTEALVPRFREEPLAPEEASQLRQRIERLIKRREQLGPVNPLAKQEYDEAVAHVDELERQRTDLETALRELRAFIRDTDRQIRTTFTETFEAAAKNFEELSQTLFPGGSGRLTLVREENT